MGLGLRGVGLGLSGFGSRVRVQGASFRKLGVGCWVQDVEVRVLRLGCRGVGCRV